MSNGEEVGGAGGTAAGGGGNATDWMIGWKGNLSSSSTLVVRVSYHLHKSRLVDVDSG